jgi:exonuclease III
MSESNRRPAHGIAIYSKHLFQCDFPSNESFEGIEIAISRTTAMADLAIINVYKPPNKPTKQLCELLLSIHKKHIKDSKVVVMGDFNIDWNKETPDKNRLHKLMVQQLDYKQVVTDPTNDYGSTIDLIFTNIDNFQCGTLETYFSDHKAIWISLSQ